MNSTVQMIARVATRIAKRVSSTYSHIHRSDFNRFFKGFEVLHQDIIEEFSELMKMHDACAQTLYVIDRDMTHFSAKTRGEITVMRSGLYAGLAELVNTIKTKMPEVSLTEFYPKLKTLQLTDINMEPSTITMSMDGWLYDWHALFTDLAYAATGRDGKFDSVDNDYLTMGGGGRY